MALTVLALQAPCLLLAARAARAQEAAADSDSVSTQSQVDQLRDEMNTALAELSARLNEVRNRTAQDGVDGVIYARWNDDMAVQHGRNQFDLDRVYLNVRGTLSRGALYRVTLDASRTSGDRLFNFLKYAYGGITFNPQVTAVLGMQQTPLIDFQETIWKYRFVQKVLSDNEGKLASSDLGVGAEGLISPALAYKVLIANGEGYTAPETGRDKTFAGRLTYTLQQGLRISAFAQYGLSDTTGVDKSGKGTFSNGLVRDRYDLTISFERPLGAVYLEALGAEEEPFPAGSHRTQSGGVSLAGWYEFAQDWRVIGKYDVFDPDRRKDDNSHFSGVAGIGYNWGNHLMLAVTDQWVNYGSLAKKANTNQLFAQAQITY
jgi:hypothetical protein